MLSHICISEYTTAMRFAYIRVFVYLLNFLTREQLKVVAKPTSLARIASRRASKILAIWEARNAGNTTRRKSASGAGCCTSNAQ